MVASFPVVTVVYLIMISPSHDTVFGGLYYDICANVHKDRVKKPIHWHGSTSCMCKRAEI